MSIGFTQEKKSPCLGHQAEETVLLRLSLQWKELVLAVGMTPESQVKCVRYSSEALSHPAEVNAVRLLGILFPSLSISETFVVP